MTMRRGRGLHHCIEAKRVYETSPWLQQCDKEGRGRCGMSRRGRDGEMEGCAGDHFKTDIATSISSELHSTGKASMMCALSVHILCRYM